MMPVTWRSLTRAAALLVLSTAVGVLPGPSGGFFLSALSGDPSGGAVRAQSVGPISLAPQEPPTVPAAKAYVLMDASTGTVLAARNQDEPLALASLTKIMTLHLVLRALRAGHIASGETVVVGGDVLDGMPPDGSVMGLEPGQTVTVRELLFGAAVGSANDACVVLARLVSGSESGFVARMNLEARRLGLRTAFFADPHGLSSLDRMSAADVATLARVYLSETPEALNYHRLAEYAWTRRLLRNRNGLLGRVAGADGLKTGHTTAAGYNLVGTAQRGGTRLIAVVMGVPDNVETAGGAGGPSRGEVYRDEAAVSLLEWGFQSYATAWPLGRPSAGVHWATRPGTTTPVLTRLPVLGGARAWVPLGPASPVAVTVQRGQESRVSVDLEIDVLFLAAPVAAGDRLGRVTVSVAGAGAAYFELKALAAIPRGGVWTLVRDGWKLIGLAGPTWLFPRPRD